MALGSARWRPAQRGELAEARARSDRMTLAERTEEAIALYVLTVAEIARDARDTDDLIARLSRQEPSPSLKERWESLHGR